MEMNSFKMFMFDVGLLTAKAGLSARLLLEGSRIFEEFKGALTEQYVAQELHAAGYPLYYFATARSTGEIDFMLQGDLDCVPIEVKAEQNLRARSLRAFCDKYKPGMAIRSSMSNYKQEDWLTNVPLYMLAEYLKRTIYVYLKTNGGFFVLNQTIQKFALSELIKWRFWSPFTAM